MNNSILHGCAGDASPTLPIFRDSRPFAPVRKRRGDVERPAILPCWRTPESYIAACYLAITSEEGADLRKRLGYIKVITAMKVVVEDCKSADISTGRNVMTSHATVSRRLLALGSVVSASAVKRARQVIERLGLSATVTEGRYLTSQERAEKQAEGKNQLRMASTRHLLVPRIWADALERVKKNPTTYLVVKEFFYKTSSVKPHQARSNRKSKPKPQPPAPLPYRRLAGKLAQRLPWLNRLPHLGGVARILMKAGIPEGWSAHDVLTEIDSQRKKLGWSTPGTIKNAHGWLKFLVSSVTPEIIEARESLSKRLEAEVEARRRAALSAGPKPPLSKAEKATMSRGISLIRETLRMKRQLARS